MLIADADVEPAVFELRAPLVSGSDEDPYVMTFLLQPPRDVAAGLAVPAGRARDKDRRHALL